MLERVSSSAECTAHKFLRRLELPTRSRRSLDPSFWRHGGDQLDVPVWWPIYLNNVRRKAQAYSVFPEIGGLKGLQSSKSRPDLENGSLRASRFRKRCQTAAVSDKTRPFTQSAIRAQQPLTTIAELSTEFEGREYADKETAEDIGTSRKAVSAVEPLNQTELLRQFIPLNRITKPTTSSDLPIDDASGPDLYTSEFETTDSKPDYSRAWMLFAESEWKAESASGLLHFLANSSERVDLKHALQAIDFIPQRLRSQTDYETAVQVAMQLHNYRSVTILIREAASKQMGDNLFFKFIAYCVDNTLWNTLAIFWDTIRRSGNDRKNIFRRAKYDEHAISKSPNFAGRYAFHFDEIEDLPNKIATLADRLARSDAVLAAQKDSLIEICKRLTYVAVESQKVMGAMTGEGALALFEVQRILNFDSKLHLPAIRTIESMPDRGAKSQLALLVYRNYRFLSPGATVPTWIYGSLLAICSDGRQRPEVYTFLLEEFAKMHDHPDDLAFQKAISACAAQGEASALTKIFKEFRRVSGPKTLYDLNPLIHVHAVVGDAEKAKFQFDRLQNEFGFSPDVVSWTSLILAHARSHHSETAFDIFEDMKKAGIKPNGFTWAILMSIASKRGDINQTQDLYEEAKKNKVPGSVYMVGALVESLLQNDEFRKAEALVLRTTGLLTTESPIRLWNSLFRHCAFKADNKAILRLQELMRISDVKADGMTYAALMTGLVVQRRTSDAAKILRTLHFSHKLKATEFHYSILIHGYVKEGNRDMAMVIYNEMQDRFPHISPSARLAMLHLQLQRDKNSTKLQPKSRMQRTPRSVQAVAQQNVWHALDYLADSLLQQTPTELSSKDPNPGFSRLLPREGLESSYLQSLIGFLQSRGADEISDQLMALSLKLTQESHISNAVLLKDLNLQMLSAIRKQNWALVEDIWKRIVGASVARGSSLKKEVSQKLEEKVDSEPSSALPAMQGIGMTSDDTQNFKSMLPETTSGTPFDGSTNDNASRILPAHRFVLSRSLSLYIQGLDYQNRHDEIINTIQQVTNRGFALSSMNWNRYVQTLSKSRDWKHRLEAFTAFEKYLLPNMPPWRLLRRGKWVSPEPMLADIVQNRGQLDKLDPSTPRPTYFTVIHLSTALLRAFRSAASGNQKELDSMQKEAPLTTAKVRRTPHVRDRIQGLLLRGRQIIGDHLPRPRALSSAVDRSGIKGSKSPLDHIPPDVASKVHNVIEPRNDIRSLLQKQNQIRHEKLPDTNPLTLRQRLSHHLERVEEGGEKISGQVQFIPSLNRFETRKESKARYQKERLAKLQHITSLGEQISGEVIKGPIFLAAQGRMENPKERRRRVERETLVKLDLVEQIRKDTSSKALVHDSYRGESSLGPFLPGNVSTTPSSVRVKTLAEALLHGNKETLSQSDEKLEAATYGTSFQPFTTMKREDPPRTISMREWASQDSYPVVDTRTFTRRIAPRSVRRDKNTPVKYTTANKRRTWSINKARRRTTLKEKQSFARWNKKTQALQEAESRRIEAEYEAAKAREQEKREDSNRVARLAMSRGARR